MTNPASFRNALWTSILTGAIGAGLTVPAAAQQIGYFTPGDLVVDTVQSPTGLTDGSQLDKASPITLNEYSLSANAASLAGTLTLPQTANGANSAISGEYGSASEGFLKLSANGQYLTMIGYGVNASAFNSAPLATYGTAALGQTTSLTGQTATTVPRVVALIGTNGSVDTTTALTGVFNKNNPRGAATVDGSSFYVSGQGVTGDGTGGVFYAAKGATTATAINANITTPNGAATANPLTATETRAVGIVNDGSGNTLYVSRDYAPSGTPNDSTDIRSLTNGSGGLLTSSAGLVANRIDTTVSVKGGNTASIDLTAALANGVNNSRIGKFVYLSPEDFFFADADTLYIADSGSPKVGSADAAALGEGGLQKWSLSNGIWSLDYDMVTGLNLVDNANANSNTPTANGVTGLFGLTGTVVGNQVELFATSYGLNELSQSFLYEITDNLSDMTIAQANADSEAFTTLATADSGTQFRGLSMAPVPEPASITVFGVGLVGAVVARRRRARVDAAYSAAPPLNALNVIRV